MYDHKLLTHHIYAYMRVQKNAVCGCAGIFICADDLQRNTNEVVQKIQNKDTDEFSTQEERTTGPQRILTKEPDTELDVSHIDQYPFFVGKRIPLR